MRSYYLWAAAFVCPLSQSSNCAIYASPGPLPTDSYLIIDGRPANAGKIAIKSEDARTIFAYREGAGISWTLEVVAHGDCPRVFAHAESVSDYGTPTRAEAELGGTVLVGQGGSSQNAVFLAELFGIFDMMGDPRPTSIELCLPTVALPILSKDLSASPGRVVRIVSAGPKLTHSGLHDALGRRTGVWSIANADGQTIVTETYFQGRREGLWIHWLDGDCIASEKYFQDNKPHGLWREYACDSKALLSEVRYADGLQDGPWSEYYPCGEVRRQGTYKNGEPYGAYTEKWENGTVKMVGQFGAHGEIGVWKIFDERGNLDRTVQY